MLRILDRDMIPIAPIGPALIQHEPPCNRKQPRSKRRIPAKRVQRTKRPNEGVLHELFGRRVHTQTADEPHHRWCVPLHQRRCGALVATVPSGDQRLVLNGVVTHSAQLWHLGLVGRRVLSGDVKVACQTPPLAVYPALRPVPMPSHRPPALIAHRGMPRRHRENTLPGFLAATAAGADGWELDVHATGDGVVVVHHDPILPTTAGRLAGARIAETDWRALAEATVGAAGERIPSLDEVLAAAGPATTVYVEVKARGIEAEVRACLARHESTPTAVHSFDHRIAQRIGQSTAGSVPVGILTDSYLIDAVHAMRAAGARDYWPNREMVDRPLVDAIHAIGGQVIVWTVNDVSQARWLVDIGVDALCSDVVDELRAAGIGA